MSPNTCLPQRISCSLQALLDRSVKLIASAVLRRGSRQTLEGQVAEAPVITRARVVPPRGPGSVSFPPCFMDLLV